MNPFQPVKDFEAALCEYTGARYAVAVNSCTMALYLALRWWWLNPKRDMSRVAVPKRTYVSVPMAVIKAGLEIAWHDEEWKGYYRLYPSWIWDSARWFTEGIAMFPEQAVGFTGRVKDVIVCTSFHAGKTLGHSQGGAILHHDKDADAWFRRMRFDGRAEGVAPKDDHFTMIGEHCYMSPDVAAALTWKLHHLPRRNEPLPNDDYPDLSQFEVFNR